MVLSTINPKLSSTRLNLCFHSCFSSTPYSILCASGRDWTYDPLINSQTLYHWATEAYVPVWASHSRTSILFQDIVNVSEDDFDFRIANYGYISSQLNIRTVYYTIWNSYTSLNCFAVTTQLLLAICKKLIGLQTDLFAEREGFEPPVQVSPHASFQD